MKLSYDDRERAMRRALLVPVSAYRSSNDPLDFDKIVEAALAQQAQQWPCEHTENAPHAFKDSDGLHDCQGDCCTGYCTGLNSQ